MILFVWLLFDVLFGSASREMEAVCDLSADFGKSDVQMKRMMINDAGNQHNNGLCSQTAEDKCGLQRTYSSFQTKEINKNGK